MADDMAALETLPMQGYSSQERHIPRDILPLFELGQVTHIPELTAALEQYPIALNALKDLRDHHVATYNHVIRTGIELDRLARQLHLSDSQKNLLVASGLVHDWGKKGVSTEILDFPGRLDEVMLPKMRDHARIGTEKVRPFDRRVASIVANHHAVDGYPVADDYDDSNDIDVQVAKVLLPMQERTDAVMTNERAYRDPASRSEAVHMLTEKGFDPALSAQVVYVQEQVLKDYPSHAA